MTDMRATERLLEVIEEATRRLGEQRIWATISSEFSTTEHGDREETHRMVSLDQHVLDLRSAITELRRRGDTLVRRDDLIRVMDLARSDAEHAREYEIAWSRDHGMTVNPDDIANVESFDRLENAIGGKP